MAVVHRLSSITDACMRIVVWTLILVGAIQASQERRRLLDSCSITEALKRSGFQYSNDMMVSLTPNVSRSLQSVQGNTSNIWADLNHQPFKSGIPMSPDQRSQVGAVVSLMTGENHEDLKKRWKCQLATHGKFCKAHGYTCYMVTDTLAWRAERDSNPGRQLPGHWMKLQALREILPRHPWVLFIDADGIFHNPENSSSIEKVLGLNGPVPQNYSIYMPGGKGWSTDMMFFMNTHWSMNFLHHFWKLRQYCPHCNGEQCAGMIAMFDALIHQAHQWVEKGLVSDTIQIALDRGNNCCFPRSHCEFPDGPQKGHNGGHTKSSQGCIWNWQAALHFNPEIKPLRTDHKHISWSIDIRQELNYEHPVKDMKC